MPEDFPLNSKRRERSEEEILQKIENAKNESEKYDKDRKELSVIISGLLLKMEVLIKEKSLKFSKLPKTDEEWKEYEVLEERLDKIDEIVKRLILEEKQIILELKKLVEDLENNI